MSTLNGIRSHDFDLYAEPVHGGGAQTLLERLRAAFVNESRPDHVQRKARLARLRAAVLAYRSEVEEAISADFGHRSRHETGIMELVGVIQAIDYLTRNLRRFMRRGRRHVGFTYRSDRAYVEYQPKGVVGVMAPWNYPFSLTSARAHHIGKCRY